MYWGFDLSLNHGAAVGLGSAGQPLFFYYVTSIKKHHSQKPMKGLSVRGWSIYFPIRELHKLTRDDPHRRAAEKLRW